MPRIVRSRRLIAEPGSRDPLRRDQALLLVSSDRLVTVLDVGPGRSDPIRRPGIGRDECAPVDVQTLGCGGWGHAVFIGRLGAILKKVVITGRCPRLIDPQAGAERIILGLKEVSE